MCVFSRRNVIRLLTVGAALALLVGVAVAGEAVLPGPVAARPVPAMGAQIAAAPSAAPVMTTADYENQPMNFAPPPSRSSRGAPRSYSVPSVMSALAYVAVICGIFIGIMYLVKNHLPGHRRLFSHPAMEVLGRSHIDQKRYVSLIRIGKRIIVVGVSPDEMRPLSEITNESEVTEIMEIARPKTEAGLTVFQRLFQKNVVEIDAETRRHDLEREADAKARELEQNISSLRERVRTIHEREEPSRHIDAMG